jgi:hypothetical protein
MAERPDQPTCETCPFWEWDLGSCHRNPPVLPPTESLNRESRDNMEQGIDLGWWPTTRHDAWCGHHPDFPEYADVFRRWQNSPSATP